MAHPKDRLRFNKAVDFKQSNKTRVGMRLFCQASTNQQPASYEDWLECCSRLDSIREEHLLDFAHIDEHTLEAVVDLNIGTLDDFKEFSGELNEENYSEIMKSFIKIDKAYNAIHMRRFDRFEQQLKIKHSFDASHRKQILDYYGVEIEGISSAQSSLTEHDFILLRNPETNRSIVMSIESINGNFIQLPNKQFKAGNFLDKPLNISIVPSGVYYVRCLKAIKQVRYMRKLIFDSPTGLRRCPLIEVEPSEPKCLEAHLRLDKLDINQRQAVAAILDAHCRPKPYLVLGPPGTGKTHVLIEAAAQIYQRSRSRILFCVKSRTCLAKTYDKLKKIDFISWLALERIPQQNNPLSYENVRIVVTTSVDWVHACLKTKYDYVFIDDAYQLLEPETLILIRSLKLNGCLVMTGDPKQLGPSLHCDMLNMYGYNRSLFERVLGFDVYRKSLQEHDHRYITELLACYRCDSRIMATSNKLFYNNAMTCISETPPSILSTLNLTEPVQFCPVNGEESDTGNMQLWINEMEAECCADLVSKLCNLGYDPSKIGVLSPFKTQAKRIHKLISDRAGNEPSTQLINAKKHCKFDTVEAYKNDERDIIIVSTVRTSVQCPLDFIDDPRRVNVALTRAKWLLIVIGNEDALNNSIFWREFINNATRNETLLHKPSA